MNQIDRVIQENLALMVPTPDFKFEAVIAVGSYQIKAMAVYLNSIREDYVSANYEERITTLALLPSDYNKIVMYGHSDITIKMTTIVVNGKERISKIYRAVLLNLRDPSLENNNADRAMVSQQDAHSVSMISFQLFDPASYELRMAYYDTISPNKCTGDVLKAALAKTRLVDKYNKQDSVGQIQMDDGYLPTKRSIIIPPGTRLLDLGRYLQKEYGVYSQGLGMFLKNRTWFVFPPFTRLKENTDGWKLVIINAPANRYRKLDRTYYISGKTVTLILTGEVKHTDTTDHDALIEGTGVRYADPAKLLSKPGSVDGTTALKQNPKERMTEYNAMAYKSKFSNAKFLDNPFTANGATSSSDLAARGGSYIEGTWERSIPEFLLPGMPVVFITQDGTSIRKMPGTLVGVETLTSSPHGGLIEQTHSTMSKLTMYLRDK